MAFRNRLRPLVAQRALRALRENPDDTAQAIRAIAALSGNSRTRLFERFRRSKRGSQILREGRDLVAIMNDIERLEAMPPSSLGAAIAEFYVSEQLSAQGLTDASREAFRAGGAPHDTPREDEEFLSRRLLGLHDVFHVLTGYGRDLRGEAAVLAFTVPQTRNLGVAYLVFDVLRRVGWRSEMGKLIRQGFRRGRRSRWLIDQEWESLLEQPIDEVRRELGIGAPPVYSSVRSAGAPPLPT